MTEKKIIVQPNGPYVVHGGIPLVRKRQVITEHGEPYAWQTTEILETPQTYQLCRCGKSKNKPFCDSSHEIFGFEGRETAVTQPSLRRRLRLPGGKHVVVHRDLAVCIEAGFCGSRFTNLEQLASQTDDHTVLAAVIGMVNHCPSGSYTYALEEDGPDIEPDFPEQISVLTEIDESGDIMSALWVTGGIPVLRADGKPFETRNRVTLCRCGLSNAKPLCDGLHRQQSAKE
jgi:CDGSH-type Zn-finger protein